jgi:hypothetical protein
LGSFAIGDDAAQVLPGWRHPLVVSESFRGDDRA